MSFSHESSECSGYFWNNALIASSVPSDPHSRYSASLWLVTWSKKVSSIGVAGGSKTGQLAPGNSKLAGAQRSTMMLVWRPQIGASLVASVAGILVRIREVIWVMGLLVNGVMGNWKVGIMTILMISLAFLV